MIARALVVLAASFCLSGCEDIPRARSERAIRDIAADVAAERDGPLIREIEDLELRLSTMESENLLLRKRVAGTADLADAVADQVAHNAKVNNDNALKEMTRRGACGTKTVHPEPVPGVITPVVRLENIPCTKADLIK